MTPSLDRCSLQIPAVPVLSCWAWLSPMTQTHNRSEIQMEKPGWRHLPLWKSPLLSHSGSSDLSLFGLSSSYLFAACFFLCFLEGLGNRLRWYFNFIWSEHEPSVFDSLFQTGSEIIYSLLFVQHSSKRPWLGCLVLETETKWSKIRDLWIAIDIVLKISSRGGGQKRYCNWKWRLFQLSYELVQSNRTSFKMRFWEDTSNHPLQHCNS